MCDPELNDIVPDSFKCQRCGAMSARGESPAEMKHIGDCPVGQNQRKNKAGAIVDATISEFLTAGDHQRFLNQMARPINLHEQLEMSRKIVEVLMAKGFIK